MRSQQESTLNKHAKSRPVVMCTSSYPITHLPPRSTLWIQFQSGSGCRSISSTETTYGSSPAAPRQSERHSTYVGTAMCATGTINCLFIIVNNSGRWLRQLLRLLYEPAPSELPPLSIYQQTDRQTDTHARNPSFTTSTSHLTLDSAWLRTLPTVYSLIGRLQ